MELEAQIDEVSQHPHDNASQLIATTGRGVMEACKPGTNRKNPACEKCRKGKRRCIHDESGKLDPAKTVAPVRAAGKVSQGRRDPCEVISASKVGYSRFRFEASGQPPTHSLVDDDSDANIERTALEPRSQLSQPGRNRLQTNAPSPAQDRQEEYSDPRTMIVPVHPDQHQQAHIYPSMAYPHPTQPLQMAAQPTTNRTQTPYQLMTPATTPTTTPVQTSFPRLDLSQAFGLPIPSVPKEQLQRERREETEAKARCEPIPRLALPWASVQPSLAPVKKASEGRQRRKVKDPAQHKKENKGRDHKFAPKQKKAHKQKAPHHRQKLPATISSVFIREPDVRLSALPDICIVHSPGCKLSSRLCQVDQFHWINPETDAHETRLWNDVPKRIGKLGKLRPDFESIGMDTKVDVNDETGQREDCITTRTSRLPETSAFWWDLWIGNIGLGSEVESVKQLCLAMQNARADNEVPRVVAPAEIADDGDAPRNGLKWLRYRDENGSERLSQMDHWGYLCEEVRRKWREVAKGKWGFRYRRILARRAARDCMQERQRRRDSRSSFMEDGDGGFALQMVGFEEIEGLAGDESKQSRWKAVKKAVRLGYRRREYRDEGEHWVTAEQWRKIAETQESQCGPSTDSMSQKESSDEESVAKVTSLAKMPQEQAIVSDAEPTGIQSS